MRLEKIVTIEREGKDPLEVKVFEMRPKDLMGLLPKDGADESLVATIDKALPLCSTITMAKIEDMYPSEIESIIEAFKEVNRPFLEMIRTMGLEPILEEARRSLLNDLLGIVTASLPPATPTASTTAGAGSSVPSRP